MEKVKSFVESWIDEKRHSKNLNISQKPKPLGVNVKL